MNLVLQEGELLDDRFELQGLAGLGGMSTIYKALDRSKGEAVALKLLSTNTTVDELRFVRESTLLEELTHPAIVRYVARGMVEQDVPYLAMEWLEGEDVGVRLSHSPLTVHQSLTIARRSASALAHAHQHGVVHRDIKPSNLFLVGGEPDQTKVVDFGLARAVMPSRVMTRTGAVLGTLGYMSPEQARGEREIDARADVFALGCVLYECLSGQCPFTGPDVVAVLVKILGGKAPNIRELRPDLPPRLHELVERMMAKSRDDRPDDASKVVRDLNTIEQSFEGRSTARSEPPKVLSRGEQRLISIILLVFSEAPDSGEIYEQATLTSEQAEDNLAPLKAVAEPMGAVVSQMANGTVLVLLTGVSTATDQARRAASCALSLLEACPGARVALTTGPAEVTGQWPEGQVIDRAANVLRQTSNTDAVFIDDVTAGLLDVRYKIQGEGAVRQLLGERGAAVARRLLGQITPCVGRAKELSFLEDFFDECLEENAAGAVLVTGSAGVGKTRLKLEFLERVKSRKAEVLIARGDPVLAGSDLTLAAQLLRDGAGLPRDRSLTKQWDALTAYFERVIAPEDRRLVAEFLGEMIGLPTADEPSPQLLAARNESRLMAEQTRRAFERWLGALAARHPVLLVIEDLHWGDLPSVNLIDAALRSHADRPLTVLALARPEVSQVFPRLWAQADVQGLHLGALKRRAASRLVRSVLGEEVPDDLVEHIVSQAGGNAFYLEELIRHVAEGGESTFPETVLAIAQSRLDGLDAEVRLVLRAGAIFGEIFWDEAVHALLGDSLSIDELNVWLDKAIEREILEEGTEHRFPDHRELAFRHDLLREAAYTMLTDQDRELGHRLAAEWLEQAGERDALALAEHYSRGGSRDRAIPYFIRAAQTAVDAGNLDAAIAIADRALGCGARGTDRGELRLIQMNAYAFRDELTSMTTTSSEALALLPEGSDTWFRALSGLACGGTWGGDALALMESLKALQNFSGKLKSIGPLGFACNLLHESLVHIGQSEPARSVFERSQAALEDSETADPVFIGWVNLIVSSRCNLGLGPLGQSYPNAQKGLERFEEAGDRVAGLVAASLVGYSLLQLGQLDPAAEMLSSALTSSTQANVPLAQGFATLFLGFVQTLRGRPEASLDLLEPLVSGNNPLLIAYARTELTLAYLTLDRLDEAEREAQLAVQTSQLFPIAHAHALNDLAGVVLALDRPAEALERLEAARAQAERTGMDQVAASLLDLRQVEALGALDRHDQARTQLGRARSRLERIAATIDDPDHRHSYLHQLGPNVSLQRLTRELL